MSLNDAIKTYHDLLTDEVALESQGQLDRQLQQRGLFFGDRPLSTVLRPRFLTPQQYNYMRLAIRPLLKGFAKISEAAIANPEFRHQFRMLDWEEELIQIDPGYSSQIHLETTRGKWSNKLVDNEDGSYTRFLQLETGKKAHAF